MTPTFWDVFGFSIERADVDGVTLRMSVTEALLSPFGQVLGGVVAALFDTALAVAIARRLEHEERIATHNLNVSFVSFTRDRTLSCHARVVSLRRSVAIAEGEVMAVDGALVAKAVGTFGVRRQG